MFKESGFPQSLLIYGICLPLAIMLGYLLANPTDFKTLALVGLTLTVLCSPLLLRWHHALVICCWNASVIVFFLPGQPNLGLVLAGVSLFISVLNQTLRKRETFLHVPSLVLSLAAIIAVVGITIFFTGGIGGRVLGSELWGAKRYLGLFGGIIGYFALTAQRVPENRGQLLAGLFFLSGVTSLGSDLAYAGGPGFYFLFAVFPTELAVGQAITQTTLNRLTGLSWAAMAGFYFILLHYGIRGIFQLSRPWRLGMLLLCFVGSMFGGYRSSVIVLSILFLVQFYLEGLFRSRLLPILLLIGILGGSALIVVLDKLPLSVQRSLSFLPVQIDATARHDAVSTLDWRLKMWNVVLQEVPKYLLLGKGYSYSGTDYYLTQEAVRRGIYFSYEDTLISGNYHHGILTIIIPFGIFGLLAFLFFCGASLRLLYRNHRYGNPMLKKVNVFLLSYFASRLLFYLTIYGQFDLDFGVFTGVVGLSIAINGGIKGPAAPRSNELEKEELESG